MLGSNQPFKIGATYPTARHCAIRNIILTGSTYRWINYTHLLFMAHHSGSAPDYLVLHTSAFTRLACDG